MVDSMRMQGGQKHKQFYWQNIHAYMKFGGAV